VLSIFIYFSKIFLSVRKISILLFLFFNYCLIAQPIIEWKKNFGGTSDDSANFIELTTDGGYILAGSSSSNNMNVGGNNGASDYWIVKLDEAGNLQWEKNLGGAENEIAESIQQTNDGGYIITGRSLSSDGDAGGNNGEIDYWIVKLDETGDLQWEKNYGGSDWDSAWSVLQADDGGYIVAGWSQSNDGDVKENKGDPDFWIVKLNETGNLQWEKNYGGSDWEKARSIKKTTDGGYVVAGESYSNDGDIGGKNNLSSDYWIIKLDVSGNLEWEKNYGGTSDEFAYSIQQTTDGGYIVAGETFSNDGDVGENNGRWDYWIVKLDQIGNLEWEKSYGGSDIDIAESVQQTTDGGYIVAGSTESNDGDVTENNGSSDYWIIKLDESGNLQWEKNYGGTSYDVAFSIQQTTDGKYIVAGVSYSDDGDIEENIGLSDYWVLKLSETEIIGIENIELNFNNYEFDIIDISGRLVYQSFITVEQLNIKLNQLALKKGIYILRLHNAKKQFSQKMVVLH